MRARRTSGSMMMNKDRLPIKYHVGVWKTLPKYPNRMDVLYEVYSYMSRKGMDKFSELTLNGIWNDQDGVANWRGGPIEAVVDELFSNGTFEKIDDESDKNWYRIKEGAAEWM